MQSAKSISGNLESLSMLRDFVSWLQLSTPDIFTETRFEGIAIMTADDAVDIIDEAFRAYSPKANDEVVSTRVSEILAKYKTLVEKKKWKKSEFLLNEIKLVVFDEKIYKDFLR